MPLPPPSIVKTLLIDNADPSVIVPPATEAWKATVSLVPKGLLVSTNASSSAVSDRPSAAVASPPFWISATA
jgi:hypothetical protein